MRLREMLSEAVSRDVFHYTSIHNAYKILTSKSFKLSAAGGSDSERALQKGKMYFLSTARSPAADYTISNSGRQGVVFNLNGDWFNQRFKGAPVDYWDRMWWDPEERRTRGGRTSEQEDRVLSDKPVIQMGNALSSAISSVHILVNLVEKDFAERFGGTLRGVLLEAKKSGVPFFIYKDRQAWLVQDKSKTIPLSELRDVLSAERPKPYASYYSTRDSFKIYRELYYKETKEQLSSQARDELYHMFNYSDRGGVLDNEIHNNRKDSSPGLTKLMDIFRKIKVRSGDGFVQWVRDKWKDQVK